MKFKIFLLIFCSIQTDSVKIHQISNSKYNQTNYHEYILIKSEQSLIEDLKISNYAVAMTYRIKYEFKKIIHLIEIEKILKSFKDKKKTLMIYNELLNFSEKFGFVEGIVNAYSMMGNIHFQKGEYPKSISLYKKALENSIKIKKLSSTIFIMQNLATIYYNMGEFKISIEYSIKSLDMGMNCKDNRAVLLSLNFLAYNYTALSQYEKALDFSLKAIEISNELNDKKTLALILHNIGNIYSDIGDYEKSLKYNIESLKIKEEIGDKLIIGTSLSSIGMIYFYLNNFNKALEYLERSIILQREVMFYQGLATVYDNLGDVHRKLGNYSQSIDNYYKAFSLTLLLNDLWNLANISNHLGQIYTEQKIYLKAKLYLDKSLYYSKRTQAKDLLLNCYLSFTGLYEDMGNYKDAYRYLRLYTNLKDSTISKSSHKIASLQIKYETEKRDKQNEILKLSNTNQNLELNKQRLISWQLFFGVSILFFLLSYFYSRYRVKIKITKRLSLKIEESIEKQNEQRKIIFHQASLITLGEYSAAIAHEINQPLQIMFFDIESLPVLLKDKKINREDVLEKIKILLENMNRIKFITGYVKNFSCRQKEYIKENFDINTMVKNTMWMVQKHYEKQGIIITLNFQKSQNIIYGSSFKLEQALLNLLSNAKDAIEEKGIYSIEGDYKNIIIKSSIENRHAILSVEDKGIGIKREIKNKIFNPFFTTKKFEKGVGLGLSVVKEVIDEMNGEIEVESIYLEGTSIKLKLPILNDTMGE